AHPAGPGSHPPGPWPPVSQPEPARYRCSDRPGPPSPAPASRWLAAVKELDAIASRLRSGTCLAELLDAGFDAFEVIRLVARAGEDLAPELFAAFITAAGTAVEGRNALGDAPSLPPATGPPPAITMSATVDAGQIADDLAAL